MPVGIDPGFQDNVGLVGGGRDTANSLIGKMDAASPEMARAVVGSPWGTALFRRHMAGREEGDWPVAAAPAAALEAVGGRSQTVRLSGATAVKQGRRHPDVEAEDYARVQRILDEGELFLEENGRFVQGFLEDGGHLWKVVLKKAGDGSALYLVTLHRARGYDLRVARRRLKRVPVEAR